MVLPMSEIKLLSEWLNHNRPEIPWQTIDKLSACWQQKRTVYPVGRERTTARCHCDMDHEEEVFYPQGKPVILCSYTGCTREVSTTELRDWRFDSSVFVRHLGELFQCKGTPEEIIGGKLWALGMTAHRIGGIPRDVYFALNLGKDSFNIYERLPKDGTQAILISGSSQMQYSDHFKADHVFCIGDILSFAGDHLELNIDAMDARLGIPVEKKKKPKNTTGCRANNVKKLLEEIKTEISRAYSHYCNQNYRDNGSQELYPRLTFEQLGERVGISKGTVSKIFSEEDENGNPAYKELHIMWDILGSKEQILKYGMKHLQNKQKGR